MEINEVFDLIEANDVQRLQQLFDSGYDVNAADEDGYSLLHMAVDFDSGPVVQLILSTKGCKANCYTYKHRLNPLHFVGQDGKIHLLEMLLNSGADINCVNHCNCTPLYFAVCAKHLATVELLLEKGADPNISDSNGISPLLQAVSINKELTSLLFQRNARLSDYCRELHTALLSNKPDIAQLILERLTTPLSANRIGRTVLQNAVQHICCDDPKDAVNLIKKIVELGEDINISNRFGTPLHILIQRTKYTNNSGEDPTSEEIFRYLVSLENCNLDQFIETNGTGTPLTLAFKLNKYLFVEMLIKAGADVKKCQLNRFKYTKSADSVLKLLFFSGFQFDDNFVNESRPFGPLTEDSECFQSFTNWLSTERTRVMSLKNTVRLFLRSYYKKNIFNFVNQHNCPKSLKSFILFE